MNQGGRRKGSGRPASSTYRQHERRDCAHYYGDGGCLDQAARDDLRAVPCRGCGLLSIKVDPAKRRKYHG